MCAEPATSNPPITEGNLVLWQSRERESVAARIAIAGDFIPAGKVPFPPGCDWRRMAQAIALHFNDTDISIANFEGVVNAEGLSARPLVGIGDIVSAPDSALDYLEAARLRVVGMANNHSYDFGSTGALRTRQRIERRHMFPLGAGRNLVDAPEVVVRRGPGNVRVGFWAAAKASADLATRRVAGAEPATLGRATHAISELQRRGARFCIALLHAGVARSSHPDPEDVALMDSFAACGFDVVAASHSHRISGWKLMNATTPQKRPSFCLYGLGTLVSGYARSPIEREGLIVVAALNSHGALVSLEARPVFLDHSGFAAIPAPEIGGAILRRFQNLAKEIADGSFARLFYRDVSRDLISFYLRDVGTALHQAGLRGLTRKAARIRMRHLRRLVHTVIVR